MTTKQYDVTAAINLPNGNTVWTKIGKGFAGAPSRNRYTIKLSIMSLPLKAFQGEILELFLYENTGYKKPYKKSPMDHDHEDINADFPDEL